jgi:hypothetical protein
MSYNRAIVRLDSKGMGYINKIACSELGLHSGLHVEMFLNSNRQAILVKSFVGISLSSVPSGLKFRALKLAKTLNITEPEFFDIVAVIDSSLVKKPDESKRICKVCQDIKDIKLFKQNDEGRRLNTCNGCYNVVRRWKRLAKKSSDSFVVAE